MKFASVLTAEGPGYGVVTPDDPEYLDLVTGLRRPLD